MMYENISAISTAMGKGGIAVIRISGNAVLQTAEKMFRPTGKTPVRDFEPYKMYPGEILADGFTDYGMCVYFKAPRSFTGEDTVEFQCHGGTAITRGILKKTLLCGCRLAERGEFTKRAFLNGKLSLSSAEGVIDMINGESEAELKAGYLLYSEKLTNQVKELQAVLTNAVASINAGIDYPEEDIEEEESDAIIERILFVREQVQKLVNSYSVGKKIKQGVSVAIAGRPNTGKSSLLNALLGYDKAIVSDIAGTTRDTVEGSLEIEGVKFNLFDTAGIRESADQIESIGIDRAKRMLESADVILFVTDTSLPFTDEDKTVYESVRSKDVIVVHNKTDLASVESSDRPAPTVRLSAKTGDRLDDLRKLLYQKGMGFSVDGAYLIEERHYETLRDALTRLDSVLADAKTVPLDMLTVQLQTVWEKLGYISGETANERIINEIFAKFCVGK